MIRKIVISTRAVTTIAGTGSSGFENGAGTSAKFIYPSGITIDGNNLYVVDSNNHMIRKIVISTKVVSTFAGSGTSGFTNGTGTAARFGSPTGIISDGTNLYVTDTNNHKIRKIVISTGVVTTLAGSGTAGSADGTGISASFNKPRGMTIVEGNLYVVDASNHKIRKIVISTGVVTTLSGSGSEGSTDNSGTSASFNSPYGITSLGSNLYVSDRNNHKIRKVALRGTETADLSLHNLDDDKEVAVAVSSSDTGEATVSPATLTFTEDNWNTAQTVTVTGVNDNNSDGHQAYKISLSAESSEIDFDKENPEVTTFASGLNKPNGVTTDGTNLYVAVTDSNIISKIVISTGVVSTFAGSGAQGSADNATGTLASFKTPAGITTDGTNLYVMDTNNHKIRKIVISTGEVTTLAGSGEMGSEDGTGILASFKYPHYAITSGTNLYVTDSSNGTIRKIEISTGIVTTFASGFNSPQGITTDGTNLYMVDRGNNKIRKIVISTKEVSTIAGSNPSGYIDGDGTTAKFNYPWGITTDGTNLYVGDGDNNMVRKIVISTGVVSTLAGSGNIGSEDGTGTDASFQMPKGLILVGTNLYVGDYRNKKIRKIDLSKKETTDLSLHNLDDDTDVTVNVAS